MAALTDREILDLTTSTLNDMGPPTFEQIAQSLPDYEVMGKWLKNDRVQIDSGVGIQRILMTDLPDSAEHVGLHHVDDVDIKDLLSEINIPWRHATQNWAYERRETLMNKGKALRTKVIEPRRIGAIINLAEKLEAAAFACPDVDDDLLPYGLPYYIVANATAGFNGGAPSGHTYVAGLNPAVKTTYKNYTGTYGAFTKADLIKKLRTAQRKISWKSPVTIQELRGAKGEQYRLYVDETTLSAFEDIGESQNENLGRDIASIDGVTLTFRRHPIIYVPYLDDNAVVTNPIYLVDHSTFYPVVLAGDYMRESDPAIKGDQHNTIVTFIDLTYNFLCINRRRNAVLYKA